MYPLRIPPRLMPLTLLAAAVPLAAQPPGNSTPQPLPIIDTIPASRDVAFPGTIQLDVDATDTVRGILRVKERIPVPVAGRMTLLFPKWLPGNHAPRGQIEKLAGLTIRAGTRTLAWTRDPLDMHAFHVDVPAGVPMLDVAFEFLSATAEDQGRIVVTPTMISLQPNSVSLYPAGWYTRAIPIRMRVTWPAGWTAAGAIPAKVAGAVSTYDTVDYDTLVDSPILAGRYGKSWPLTDRVRLNVFADDPAELAATPGQIDAHRRLVEQAVKTFGAQHYDRYEFLLSITDQLGGIGLEHHRSSENGVVPGYFAKWAEGPGRRNLLPHEFTHSWNGKFRRGADLWTPDFRTPMRTSLLWVYEGQTQFWGYVLQARSGMVSKQDTLDQLAMIAATYDSQPARQWRDLADTTNDPVIAARRPKGWTSWQRSEDYYNEGLLVWMDVDSLLRERSGGRKSIDDFARAFFGTRDGDWGVLTYDFEEVVRTLNGVQPWDWAGYLNRRLTEHAAGAPIEGFARNGYRLVYGDTATPAFRNNEKVRKILDLSHSGGLVVGAEAKVSGVTWGSPAFDAGLVVGATIVSVNGLAYSDEALRGAITAGKGGRDPVTLIVKRGKRYDTLALRWNGGLRYPRLEKTGAGEGGLDRLLTAR